MSKELVTIKVDKRVHADLIRKAKENECPVQLLIDLGLRSFLLSGKSLSELVKSIQAAKKAAEEKLITNFINDEVKPSTIEPAAPVPVVANRATITKKDVEIQVPEIDDLALILGSDE